MDQTGDRSSSIAQEWARLGRMRKEGDLDGLLLELQNPAAKTHDDGVTVTVRERVPAQLRKLRAPEAVPALCKAMVEDDSARVRAAAALALRKMRATP